jgi:hypothetical protein
MLTRWIGSAVEWMGWGGSLRFVYVGIGWVGLLWGIALVRRLLRRWTNDRHVPIIGALFYGSALGPWFYWNGELEVLAVAFSLAALDRLTQDKLSVSDIVLAGVFWGLSVLSHAEMVLAALPFVAELARKPAGRRRAVFLAVLLCLSGATTALSGLLIGGAIIGKWHDVPSLYRWLFGESATVVGTYAEGYGFWPAAKALKGLFTSFSAAGHVLADLMRGRVETASSAFLVALLPSILVVAGAVWFIARGLRLRGPAIVPGVWISAFLLLFNFYYQPAQEEYHIASTAPFVLLIGLGMWEWLRGDRGPSSWKRLVCIGFLIIHIALNLLGSIIPAKLSIHRNIAAAGELKHFSARSEKGEEKALILACEDENVIRWAGQDYLRVRTLTSEKRAVSAEELRIHIRSRLVDEARRGRTILAVNRGCKADYWNDLRTLAGKSPLPEEIVRFQFDFLFLDFNFWRLEEVRWFYLNPTSQTNPFNWRRGELYLLSLKR